MWRNRWPVSYQAVSNLVILANVRCFKLLSLPSSSASQAHFSRAEFRKSSYAAYNWWRQFVRAKCSWPFLWLQIETHEVVVYLVVHPVPFVYLLPLFATIARLLSSCNVIKMRGYSLIQPEIYLCSKSSSKIE